MLSWEQGQHVLVKTESDLFRPTPLPSTEMLTLLRFFTTHRHEWLVEPATIADLTGALAHYGPAIPETVPQLAKKAFQRKVAYGLPDQLTLSVNAANVADAIEDLQLPGVIICEDIVSDAEFIKSLAVIFGRDDLVDAFATNRLDFANGGGSRLPQVAQKALEKFKLVNRVFAILDSDRLVAADVTHCHSDARKLRGLGASAYVLERREAENYIPSKALHHGGLKHGKFRRHKALNKSLSALKKLNVEQRAYYDFKSGFASGPFGPVKVKPEQQDLFGDVDARILRELSAGFGDKILGCVAACQRQLEPEDFAKLGPDVVGEIEEILNMIGRQA